MKPTTEKPYQKREKTSNSASLINFVDIKPIAGVGDSLIELEAKLSAIDADLYFQLNKDEGHAEL